MSVKISHWVWQESDAKGNDLLVLLALADNANDQGECWPSMAYLANKTRLHTNTIRKRLNSLRASGIVSWGERPGGSNLFVIDITTPTKMCTPTESVPLHPGCTPPLHPRVYPTPTPWGVDEPSMNHQEPSREVEEEIPTGTTTAKPLPKPFTLTAEMRAWAAATVPSIDIEGMTREFVAYWREGEGKGKRKKNWVLTWRNWAKRARQDDVRRGVVADEDIRDGILWRNGMPTLGGPQGMTTEQYRAWQDEREEFMRARNAQ